MNSLQDGVFEIGLPNREVFFKGGTIISCHPVQQTHANIIYVLLAWKKPGDNQMI